MNIILIISAILLPILFINSRIRSKRKILSFELRIIYDRIELSVIKNGITPDNMLIKYLQGFKYLSINPSLADIQVLLGIIKNADKTKLEQARNNMNAYEATLPKETTALADEFNSVVNNMVKLSMFKIDFILFLFWIVPPILIHKGIKGINDIFARYIANIKDEVSIVSFGRLAAAA